MVKDRANLSIHAYIVYCKLKTIDRNKHNNKNIRIRIVTIMIYNNNNNINYNSIIKIQTFFFFFSVEDYCMNIHLQTVCSSSIIHALYMYSHIICMHKKSRKRPRFLVSVMKDAAV